MPDEFGLLPQIMADGIKRVVVAIASGKNNDAKFHDVWVGGLIYSLAEANKFLLNVFNADCVISSKGAAVREENHA